MAVQTLTLPIHEILDPLRDAVASGVPVVLKAPPGAGKTTGVPLALLGTEGVAGGQVWVIQPRRLAARSVAEFLARSLNEPIGRTIGYHVRLDRKESTATRVLLMTTGMFLRRMQSDPLLENVSCVILDEFHERSLELDLSLALTQRLRTELRAELRLIVMSATLEMKPIAEFLGPDAVSLACEGRSYPVEIQHHDPPTRQRIEATIASMVKQAAHSSQGHVLVFLPGVAEIHRVARELNTQNIGDSFKILPLHGSLSPAAQDEAVRRTGPDVRKIILATNIAETSVTVEGVTVVVDSGLAKMTQLDARLGLTRLQTMPISIASADQRAGRAGRTAPGVCHRMWTATAHRTRDAYDRPEILRADLTATVLTLASLGETDFGDFPWLTPPPEHAVRAATNLLERLGAIAPSEPITALGQRLSNLPLHPRIGRFAMEAVRRMEPDKVAIAAALLSERDPLEQTSFEAANLSFSEKTAWLNRNLPSVNRTFQGVVKQIRRALEQTVSATASQSKPSPLAAREVLPRALLCAYPDRVVIRRVGDADRGVMVGRRGVMGLSSLTHLDRTSQFLLCYDVDGQAAESRVRGAVAIDEPWLPEYLITQGVDVDFDETREAISCRVIRRYLDLILAETPVACEATDATAERLYQHAILQPGRVLPECAPGSELDFNAYLHRIHLVQTHCTAKPDPPVENVSRLFHDVCRELCRGRRSFADLRKAAWKDYLIARVGYEFWQSVQRQAPTHLVLPTGNRVRVGYLPDRPPWIEAKIQECFGWPDTPRILGGKIAVQLHLLGPNRRPQQITDDLQSFWANTYGEIRKELRRRYPKHHWPEDPQTAVATPNGLKPRNA